jgi:hypothetical protein
MLSLENFSMVQALFSISITTLTSHSKKILINVRESEEAIKNVQSREMAIL